MYYIGFFETDMNKMMMFYSPSKPTKREFSYFGKVLGPYKSEQDVKNTMKVLQRTYGYSTYGYRPNPMKVASHKQALGMIQKVMKYAKKLMKHELHGMVGSKCKACKYKKNPGEQYHNQKFMTYLRDSDKFKIGSQQYIEAIAKAYEHLKSAQDSIKE